MGRRSAHASPSPATKPWTRRTRDRLLPEIRFLLGEKADLLVRLSGADERAREETWQGLSWDQQGSLIFEAILYDQASAATRLGHSARLGYDLTFLGDIAAAQMRQRGPPRAQQDRGAAAPATQPRTVTAERSGRLHVLERGREDRERAAAMGWQSVMRRLEDAQQAGLRRWQTQEEVDQGE